MGRHGGWGGRSSRVISFNLTARVIAACGSLLFTFGSVLMWAVLRNVLPDNKYLAVAAGVASGVTLTAVGKEYLEFIDSKLK
ncbi:hypothetical protein J6590_056597 [Homalodisca vitripennis]|nr:hypothetical protein J6590_089888 [Homalodisca vitripennis]KAG8320965.1 hypothetical protein J6590_056597 [Homalodisca vitripennis]